MSHPQPTDRQFDLFVPFIADIPLRDQRETMERPFFSLSKNKRLKPIEYTSPDGQVYVNVFPNPEFGMATIWDADILIWAASILCNSRRSVRTISPVPSISSPTTCSRPIRREPGGKQYTLLRGIPGTASGNHHPHQHPRRQGAAQGAPVRLDRNPSAT